MNLLNRFNPTRFYRSYGILYSTTIALTVAVIMIALIAFIGFNFVVWGGRSRTDEWGQFGDFIGGTLGTILAFITIVYIRNTYVQQKEEATKNEIENRFLKLIEIHRENVSNMKIKMNFPKNLGKAILPQELYEGMEVFETMNNDFLFIYEKVRTLYSRIFKPSGIDEMMSEAMNSMDMSYRFLSLGANQKGDFTDYHIEKLVGLKSDQRVSTFIALIKLSLGKSFIPKYHFALSNYHRHIFQIVKYIDKQSILQEYEKYEYMKMLRAQLSTHEQAILFYNSLSSLGAEWEKKYTNKDSSMQLITKYNLIKNLTEDVCYPIKPHFYYPLIDFEYLSIDARKHVHDQRKNAGYQFKEIYY